MAKSRVTENGREQARSGRVDVEILVAHPGMDLERQFQLDAELQSPPQPVIAQRLRISLTLARDMDPAHKALGVAGSLQRVERLNRLIAIGRLNSEPGAIGDDRFQRDIPAGCGFAAQTV